MFDTHLPDIVIDDAILVGKVAHYFRLFRRGDVFVRDKVVGDHDNLLWVEDLFHPDAPELADGNRRGDVIGKDEVSPHVDKFTRRDFSFATVRGQYFLSKIHLSSSLFEGSLFIVLWGWKVRDEENCQNDGSNNSCNQ